MPNTAELITRYRNRVTIKLWLWWFIDILLILAIGGWTIDLIVSMGPPPIPFIKVTLIVLSVVFLLETKVPSRIRLLEVDRKKTGLKSELASAVLAEDRQQENELREYRDTLEGNASNEETETKDRHWF